MNRFVVTLIAAFACAVLYGSGADSLLRLRQANFDRFYSSYPQERVYLHFDNSSYYKG